MGRIQAWVWVAGLLLLVLAGMALVSRAPDLPGVSVIRSARVTPLEGAVFTPKTVPLPHVWDDESPPWQGATRYALAWPAGLQQPVDERLGLYIPRVGARFRVWLNGRMVEQQGWDEPGYVDTSVVPQLVDLHQDMLRSDGDASELVIEVRGQLMRKSGLSSVSLGPYNLLQLRYLHVYWWQVHATWMVAACSALLAILSTLIWLQGRERVFALLAGASVAWVIRLGLTPQVNPGMPFELWFFLHKLSFTLYCGFLYLFLWELFDRHRVGIRRLVVALMWISPLWLGVTTLAGDYNMYRVWTGALAAVSVIGLILMFAQVRRGLDANQRLMIVVGAVTLITGVRDFGVVQLGWPGDADLRWMTPGSLVFMLTLAWVLVQRTSHYVLEIRQLNRDLEHRVAQKESELRAAFNLLRDAERRQVLEQERRRLTRDMHDGLGSQLVQTLNAVRTNARVDPEAVTGMLHHALEELRLTLDSLEPLEGDLPAILGTLRRRISPALEAAGIELDWQVEEVPALAGVEARGVMHLFRALQEVFANIVKHASATRVTVRTWSEDGHVLLGVSDNGVGLGAGHRDGGRGLANIRMRAAELGATVRFEDARPGTRVLFRFPAAPRERVAA